jgi:hypothetical protein
MKIFGSNLFLRESFCTQKNFDENYWFKPVYEEIIFHPKKLYQKSLDEKICFKHVFEEIILQPKTFVKKIWTKNL